MKTFLFAFTLIFTGCSSPEELNRGQVSTVMDNMNLRIQLTNSSYNNYISLQNVMLGNTEMYNLMTKSFDKELKLAKKVEGYDDPEQYISNDAIKLKEAGVNVVETYISVAKTELKQVKDENLRWESERCQWFYEGGNIRIQEALDAYSKIYNKIAANFDIILI